MKSLLTRTPQEWRAAIDAIPDQQARRQVACIVWYDYFGDRSTAGRWPHLDDYVRAFEADQAARRNGVRAALVDLGYSEKEADKRAKRIAV